MKTATIWCLTFAIVASVSVAFALMGTAMLFLVLEEGTRSLGIVGDTLFGALDEFTLMSIPLFHLHGLGNGLLGALASGCTTFLVPRFKADVVLDLIKTGKEPCSG